MATGYTAFQQTQEFLVECWQNKQDVFHFCGKVTTFSTTDPSKRTSVNVYNVSYFCVVCKVCQTALDAAEVEQTKCNSFDLAATLWVGLGQA